MLSRINNTIYKIKLSLYCRFKKLSILFMFLTVILLLCIVQANRYGIRNFMRTLVESLPSHTTFCNISTDTRLTKLLVRHASFSATPFSRLRTTEQFLKGIIKTSQQQSLRPYHSMRYLESYVMPNVQVHFNDDLLYPKVHHGWDGRTFIQLGYISSYLSPNPKILFMPHTWNDKRFKAGNKIFRDLNCKVKNCVITRDYKYILEANMVLISHKVRNKAVAALKKITRVPNQIWAFYNRESPHQAHDIFGGMEFNWTITYSPKSTVFDPYALLYPINPEQPTRQQLKNFAANKYKMAAWFVSNCNTPNRRMEYVQVLSKYITVDIFGNCGDSSVCSKIHRRKPCTYNILPIYKFYLAFENANCETYITEKFFEIGLGNDILPIVMGAEKEYYKRIAPPHSYIHVEDFKTAKDLADYLHLLDRNDTLYNQYFEWKGAWRYLPDSNWLCRVCGLMNAPLHPTYVHTKDEWARTERCRTPVSPT